MNILKYIRKYIISFLFIFSITFPCISSYAVSLSDIDDYFRISGRFDDLLWQTNQITTNQEHMQHILDDMYDILQQGGYNGSNSGSSLESNGYVTINTNGDIILSTDLRNALSQAIQNEIDDNMGLFYAYSYTGADWVDRFPDQTQYNSFLNILNSNENKLIVPVTVAYNYPTEVYVYDMSDVTFVLDQYNSSTSYYFCDIYKNWQHIEKTDCEKYYTLVNGQYVLGSVTAGSYEADECSFKKFPQGIIVSQTIGVRATNLNLNKFIIYKSFSSMQSGSLGQQDYYTGNDFSTNSVSTTTTITQTQLDNSISYGDVNNYINNYYVTNGSYPDPTQINIYINNYTGGGGDDGDDDDDDDNNFDWGFLDTIGDFIGHLISGLGNALSGILELLTDVIDLFIGENGLPNIFSQLISYFLGFLPVEFIRLIELFVVCSLILGIIRLIRGH